MYLKKAYSYLLTVISPTSQNQENTNLPITITFITYVSTFIVSSLHMTQFIEHVAFQSHNFLYRFKLKWLQKVQFSKGPIFKMSNF